MTDSTGSWPRWITATVAVASAVVAACAIVASASSVASASAVVAGISALAYIAQSHHYDKRKELNNNVPKTLDEALAKEGADDSISAACHQFTAEFGPNVKVCWKDGTEGIYDYNRDLVLDPRDIGTYNFVVPNSPIDSVLHGVVDVFPWIIFGNQDDDTTWMYQRIFALIMGAF